MPANRRAQSWDVCVWIRPLTIGCDYRGRAYGRRKSARRVNRLLEQKKNVTEDQWMLIFTCTGMENLPQPGQWYRTQMLSDKPYGIPVLAQCLSPTYSTAGRVE